MTGIVSRATGSTGCATALDADTIAPGCDPSIIATITSTFVGGTSSGCDAPAMVDTTSAADSSARPDVGGGITSVTG